MRKDPCAQINLRLDSELARKLKALSAISGRSLNALITLAVDEYLFLRRATVLQGQKIVDGYANFDATLKPVRSAEEREALQAAQSQELKSAIQAEKTAYAQAQATAPEPTPMAGTQGQAVESVNTVEAPVHAEHVQTAEAAQVAKPVDAPAPVEGEAEEACYPWARAQDATQEENQDVPAPSAPMMGGRDAAPEDMDQEESQEPEEASQSMPANESEGQDASQEEPSHMAGNQDASQTVEAAPVDALQALDLDGMTREELQALARELKAQGQTNKQIAAHVGKSEATVSRWLR